MTTASQRIVLCLVTVWLTVTLASCRGGNDNYGPWETALGTDITTLAVPDYHANYFVFSFARTEGDAPYVGLRITGEFGHARYMSYNIYETSQGTTFGSLFDMDMKPLPGNINPFLFGADPNASNRAYVVTVQPAGNSTNPDENTMTYDPNQIATLTVILRYYLPEGDDMASVPIPTIDAFDVRTHVSVPLPERVSVMNIPESVFTERLKPIFSTIVDDTLRFYHVAGAGQFQDADNMYLVSPVDLHEDDVAVFRFLPPTFSVDNSEYGKTDVRYWSINEVNPNSSTPVGEIDLNFAAASDGFVYVAIGDSNLRSEAEQRGYNFMEWEASGTEGLVLYRHLLTQPAYVHSIANVPRLDLTNPANIYTQDAKNFLGDYAPTGRNVSRTEFLENGGGIVPPGTP